VIAGKTGGENVRVWKIELTNLGNGRADGTRINIFSVTQSGGDGACHPKVIDQLPIKLKGIAPGGHADVDVPIDFSKCAKTANFNVNLIFFANNGADVGDFVGTAEPR
jgi:hypothetical protein